MKTDVQQRMVDHMLETSKLMNGNDSVILISSDSEEEESGSVIDLTGVEKEDTDMGSQGQNGVVVNDLILSLTEVVDNVLAKNNGNQTSTDTDTFCAKFNSAFDKTIAKGSESASSVTEEGTVANGSGGEEANVTQKNSQDIDDDLISSPSRSHSPGSVSASIQRSPAIDTTQTSNEKPVDNSTSENQGSSSKRIHSTSETSKSDLSEAMPDAVQDIIQDDSLSSHHSQMDLCDETVLTGDEKNDTIDNLSLFGRRKRPSGRKNDAVIANTPDENIEIMKRTLRCFQCHRVFLSTDDVEDENHYCAFYGNLKTPLRIDPSPTPSKKVSLKCVICPSPVFSDSTELMKHIILGHEIDWFIEDAEKHLHLLSEDDHALHECWDCDCDDWADTEEDYFLHQGIYHERLFWALKHNRRHNFKNLCKRLFPGKMKDNPDLLWSEDSMDEVRKRLRSDEECEENTDESSGPSAKRILLLADKSREEEERSKDVSQENEEMNHDEDSDSFFPSEFSGEHTDTDKRNENTSNGEAGVEEDSSESNSTDENIKVMICVRETSGEKEYCNYCHELFSRRERLSHGCVQAFEPKILDDIVLLRSEDDSDDDGPLSSNMADINRVMADPKDMRKAIMEVCSDAMSDNGDRSRVSDGLKNHEAQSLEAWG